jgi:release factor glutamine methyltransferase
MPNGPGIGNGEPGTVGCRLGDLSAMVANILGSAGVGDAREEARDLIAALLDVPRFWPTLNADTVADDDLRRSVISAARKRARGAPFAYAAGRAAFRHLTLAVDERVLIPRQETEVLVDLVLGSGLPAGGVAIDVGTGSGAIALALAAEGAFDRVIAIDVSRDALDVARQNVAQHAAALRCPVDLRAGAFLGPTAGERARLVISNPPYIAFHEAPQLPASVRDWEPPLALLSADSGLAGTRQIISQSVHVLEPGGLLALECDERRATQVCALILAVGGFDQPVIHPDLTGRDRFVLARRPLDLVSSR